MAGGLRAAILHVGPHKTGTTYLQRCLAGRRAELAARGFFLPAAWERSRKDFSHTGLTRAIMQAGDLTRVTSVLAQDLAPGLHTLLASAEDLSLSSVADLRRLRQALEGMTVQIVYYVRRWSDVLPSFWQELIEQGFDTSLPTYLFRQLRNPEASREMNVRLRLQPFIEAFGETSIRLVCYSILQENQTDLFAHFAARFLNWHDATPPANEARPNASRDALEIELLRQLNALAFRATGEREATTRVMYAKRKLRDEASHVFEAMRSSATELVFRDATPPLALLHRELFEKLQERIVPPVGPKRFFRPSYRKITHIESDYLLQPGVSEAIRGIYAATLKRGSGGVEDSTWGAPLG